MPCMVPSEQKHLLQSPGSQDSWLSLGSPEPSGQLLGRGQQLYPSSSWHRGEAHALPYQLAENLLSGVPLVRPLFP